MTKLASGVLKGADVPDVFHDGLAPESGRPLVVLSLTGGPPSRIGRQRYCRSLKAERNGFSEKASGKGALLTRKRPRHERPFLRDEIDPGIGRQYRNEVGDLRQHIIETAE